MKLSDFGNTVSEDRFLPANSQPGDIAIAVGQSAPWKLTQNSKAAAYPKAYSGASGVQSDSRQVLSDPGTYNLPQEAVEGSFLEFFALTSGIEIAGNIELAGSATAVYPLAINTAVGFLFDGSTWIVYQFAAGGGGQSDITIGAGLTGNGSEINPLTLNLSAYYAANNVSVGYSSSAGRLVATSTATALYFGNASVISGDASSITLGTSSHTIQVAGAFVVNGTLKLGTTTVAAANIVSNPVAGIQANTKIWLGDAAGYDAIVTKDQNTVYVIKDS